MTAATVALAYAALRSAAASHCYDGLIEDFKVTFYEKKPLFSRVISYRDTEANDNTIHVNTVYVKTKCDLVGSIAYLSMYKNVSASFPEPKYPVKGISQYFSDQAKSCCESEK